MFKVTINKEKFTINTRFDEITIKELHKGYEYLLLVPSEVLDYLKPIEKGSKEPVKTIDESLLLDFQIHWISLFSNIPKDILKRVPPKGFDIMSIEHVFKYVHSFLYAPEKYNEITTFELKEIKYDLVEELTSINGAKTYFAEGTYNQFKLSHMLATQIEGKKNTSTTEGLVQLTAVLYTHKNDNSNEAINEKIGLFWELDALTCWSSYFFFVQSVSKWKNFFQSYMGKTTYRQQNKAVYQVQKERLQNKLLKLDFGKLWKSKLQNYNFSIMDWKE